MIDISGTMTIPQIQEQLHKLEAATDEWNYSPWVEYQGETWNIAGLNQHGDADLVREGKSISLTGYTEPFYVEFRAYPRPENTDLQ